MVVSGPPFYDPDELEPDGPTLLEMIGSLSYALHGQILLMPWQLHVIQKAMMQDYGRGWKGAMQAFVDELTPTFEQSIRTVKAMVPVVEAMTPPKPPKNGPQFNPHARRGKGGRR